MKQIFPDLWQTDVEHPFWGVSTHAYLLVQETGNILFYNTSIKKEYAEIKELGGISSQYVSHMDEAGPSLAEIKREFGSKLCFHKSEVLEIGKYAPADYLFDKTETIGNVEIIHTPGHTRGSVCFLVHSTSGKKYLFTGDTFYLNHGKWDIRVNGYGGGSKTDLMQSLKLLREIDADVIIFSASQGNNPYKEVTTEEWRLAVDNVLHTLA